MKMTALTLSQQLRDGNLFAEQCPSREVLKHVTSRWGVLILVALRDGTHRFSDLRRKMGGVSENAGAIPAGVRTGRVYQSGVISGGTAACGV